MSQLAVSSGSKYSDQERRRAALEYAIHGTMSIVAANLNIPETTLYTWKQLSWWEDTVAELREQNKDLIDSQLERLAIKGFQTMYDRMEHGDYYLTKEKNEDGLTVDVLKRKPVSLRDVSTASGIAYDKMRLHRNQPTSIKAESTDARLTQLAEKVRVLQGGMVTVEGEVVKNKT